MNHSGQYVDIEHLNIVRKNKIKAKNSLLNLKKMEKYKTTLSKMSEIFFKIK